MIVRGMLRIDRGQSQYEFIAESSSPNAGADVTTALAQAEAFIWDSSNRLAALDNATKLRDMKPGVSAQVRIP